MPGIKMQKELDELCAEFLDLATCMEDILTVAVDLLRAPDHDETALPIAGDLEHHVRQIEDQCQRILVLYQPVAVDFRQVLAVLRMAHDLERIGDLARGVAEQGVPACAARSSSDDLLPIATSVFGVVRATLDAYRRAAPVSVRWARRTCADAAERGAALTGRLVAAMRADAAAVEPGLGVFSALRGCQQIADHALALAEGIAVVTGPGVRPFARALISAETDNSPALRN
jgi:phosphate transport system protein